jgi:hypothetical protein
VAATFLAVSTAAANPHADKQGGNKPQDHKKDDSRMEHRDHDKNYAEKHGEKFKDGYLYRGKEHYHWTDRYYWKKYDCYCYWCPYTRCWYYWSEKADCYYPVSYITVQAPTMTATATATATATSGGTASAAAAAADSLPTVAPDGTKIKR